jgi:hypothetical protein
MMRYRIRKWLHGFIRRHTSLPICHGITGPCLRKGKRRRQNTAYVEDERNWVVACDDCFEEIEEYWNKMWREYYGVIL